MVIPAERDQVRDPETGEIVEQTEVERLGQQESVSYFITRSTRNDTRPQLEWPMLGPDEYGILTHLESALPALREEQ